MKERLAEHDLDARTDAVGLRGMKDGWLSTIWMQHRPVGLPGMKDGRRARIGRGVARIGRGVARVARVPPSRLQRRSGA